jgi:nicotinate-nucleotide adenylyltransferase
VKKQAYGKILIQEIAALDISSTKIREKIAQDKDVRSMVPEALLSYIQQHQLYR